MKDGDPYVEIQIKDNGMGIKRKDKAKLFKLFGFVQTTEDVNTRGIGLGLVISKKIVECFDGKIGFKSKWKEGSTFGFNIKLERGIDISGLNQSVQKEKISKLQAAELDYDQSDIENEDNGLIDLIFGNPVLPQNVLQHLPEINQAQNYGKITHEVIDDDDSSQRATQEISRVLIVDDEPYNIDALKIVLQCATADISNFNFRGRVDTATNGAKAVDLVKARYKEGFNYKLILMDCNMPRMDGYAATDLIRKFITDSGVDQPTIIGVSGHVEEKYIQRALKAGMNRMISKPALVDDVRETTN